MNSATRTTVRERTGGTAGRRALTVAGGAAAALAVWTLAGPVAGLDVSAASGGSAEPVGAGAVALSSLLAGLLGWGLLAVLERTASSPARVWTITAGALLVLSMTGPLGAAEGAAVLAGMHLAVAAVLIPALPRRG